eukprot:SAG11_NODE_2124_length_3784_cov_1.668657_1_plen_92_part_00
MTSADGLQKKAAPEVFGGGEDGELKPPPKPKPPGTCHTVPSAVLVDRMLWHVAIIGVVARSASENCDGQNEIDCETWSSRDLKRQRTVSLD